MRIFFHLNSEEIRLFTNLTYIPTLDVDFYKVVITFKGIPISLQKRKKNKYMFIKAPDEEIQHQIELYKYFLVNSCSEGTDYISPTDFNYIPQF